MILSAKQIENSVDWLLKNGSPPVQYLTHKHLQKTPADSETMKALWQGVEASGEVTEIFGKQRADGSWCGGGSWALKPSYQPQGETDPYTPKYATTVWVLPILGEIGYTQRDGRIQKACDFVLTHGYFRNPIFTDPTAPAAEAAISPCRFSQYLIALGAVGCLHDVRVDRGYEFLLKTQRKDGGWALPQHMEERRWDRSCPWSTYHAAMALYYQNDPECRHAFTGALAFLIRHLSAKSENELCRFFYHGHNTVKELLMFSEHKTGLGAKPVQTIIRWLMTLYRAEEGYFQYNGKPVSKHTYKADGMDARVAKYRLHHLAENDWLTYYMTRIGMNALA